MRYLILALAALLLAGCAQQMQEAHLRLPELKLAPAGFGQSISLAQRLTLEKLPDAVSSTQVAHQRSLDALLEIEPDAVRLAGFAFGQRIITLSWDGENFSSQRHPMLPAEVDASHILRDIQLVYWPAQMIRLTLPADWTLEDSGELRVLSYRSRPVVTVQYSATPRWIGHVDLDNRLERYRLLIESSPAAGS